MVQGDEGFKIIFSYKEFQTTHTHMYTGIYTHTHTYAYKETHINIRTHGHTPEDSFQHSKESLFQFDLINMGVCY